MSCLTEDTWCNDKEGYQLPDAKIVQDVQEGKALALGANPKATIKAFLTEDVSFARVALALSQVLEARVYMCNCPFQTERTTKAILMRQLIKVSLSIPDVARPVPEEALASSEVNATNDKHFVPAQQHRYMANFYAGEETAQKKAATDLEEVLC